MTPNDMSKADDQPQQTVGPSRQLTGGWWDRVFDDGKSAKIGCYSVIGFLGALGILLTGYCSDQSVKEAAIQAEKDKAAQAEQAKERADNKRKGFHCLSGWDGSHSGFVEEVKARLRDPDSFEHIETRVTPVAPNGKHRIVMTFRSRNGFGGVVPGRAIGSFRSLGCSAVVEGVE